MKINAILYFSINFRLEEIERKLPRRENQAEGKFTQKGTSCRTENHAEGNTTQMGTPHRRENHAEGKNYTERKAMQKRKAMQTCSRERDVI